MAIKNLAIPYLKERIKGTRYKSCYLAVYTLTDNFLIYSNLPEYPFDTSPSLELKFKPIFGDELHWYASDFTNLLSKPISSKIVSAWNLGGIRFKRINLNTKKNSECRDLVEQHLNVFDELLSEWEIYSETMFDSLVEQNLESNYLKSAQTIFTTFTSISDFDSASRLAKQLSTKQLKYRLKHHVPQKLGGGTFIDYMASMTVSELENYTKRVRAVSRFGDKIVAPSPRNLT